MGPVLSGVPRLRYSSGVKIVCDGNSLTHSFNTGTPYPTLLKPLAPLSNAVTIVNSGASGQNTTSMIDNASDIEVQYDATKTNILIVWEGTNQMGVPAQTAALAAAEMKRYIGLRLEAHPDRMIMLLTTAPRQNGGTEAVHAALNARFDEYNDILRANYRAWGVKVLVDVRAPGSPWAFFSYTRADFDASQANTGVWAANEVNTYTHFSTAGYTAIANMVAAGLRRMPAR